MEALYAVYVNRPVTGVMDLDGFYHDYASALKKAEDLKNIILW